MVEDPLDDHRIFNASDGFARTAAGTARVNVDIELPFEPLVIEKILTHLNEKALPIQAPLLPESRALRVKRAGSIERKESTQSTQAADQVAAPQTQAAGNRLA